MVTPRPGGNSLTRVTLGPGLPSFLVIKPYVDPSVLSSGYLHSVQSHPLESPRLCYAQIHIRKGSEASHFLYFFSQFQTI